MRKGIIASAALHIGVIGATLITWPSRADLGEEITSVPVELVTLSDVTNIQAAVREPPPPLAPPPVEAITPVIEPEEMQIEAMPQPEPEPLPEPVPEPEPEVSEVVPEPEPPPPPRPTPRPEEPEEEFDLDSVIALLDNSQPRAVQTQSAPVEEAPRQGIGAQNAMTASLQALIVSQMEQCWNVPAGAPNAEQLLVGVTFYLLRNGELARPPQLTAATRSAMASNPYLRAAAESALRAVNICAPYRNLPVDQYAQWQEITVTFDPARMVGR
jgi:hypothetical protein